MVDFRKVRSIAVFIFPDVEELDFVGVYETLGSISTMLKEGILKLDGPLKIDILATESPVKCTNGLKVLPEKISSDFTSYDVLIIPGGGGIRPLMKDDGFLEKLREFAKDHVICSVCTGSLLLGAAGILEGKKALTHQWYVKELQGYAEPARGRVHVDGNVVTAAGVSSSIDLGLKLIELIFDASTADKVAGRLELPSGYHR
jgi:transcriptional regulator GlxA family with amidase domain